MRLARSRASGDLAHRRSASRATARRPIPAAIPCRTVSRTIVVSYHPECRIFLSPNALRCPAQLPSLDESEPEYRMRDVRLRLPKTPNGVRLRQGADTQAGELRKDVTTSSASASARSEFQSTRDRSRAPAPPKTGRDQLRRVRSIGSPLFCLLARPTGPTDRARADAAYLCPRLHVFQPPRLRFFITTALNRTSADRKGTRLGTTNFPPPYQAVVGLHNLTDQLESAFREHLCRRIFKSDCMGPDDADLAGAKRPNDQCTCRFCRVSTTLVLRINSVRDLHDPVGARRAFISALSDYDVTGAMNDGEKTAPRVC